MRALRLAPVLLALAACTVDTKSLEPRTDAACAAQDPNTKACGYRCVSLDDPATGCATPGDCSPCPSALANTIPGCDAGACTVYCVGGWSDCNLSGTGPGSDGCETRIDGNDPSRCGSCTRTCPSGVCTDGACDGLALTTITLPVKPRDLASIDGALYYVDAGAVNVGTTAIGAIWNVDTNTKAFFATGPDAKYLAGAGSGAALFSGYYEGQLAMGAVALGFNVYQPYPVLAPASSSDEIAGLEYLDPFAFFTAEQQDQVWYFDGTTARALDPAAPGAKGFATHAASGRVYYGTTANGGELRYATVAPAGPSAPQVLRSGTGHPSRLAVFDNPSSSFPVPLIFWISEDDGSVRGARTDGVGGIATLVNPQDHAAVHADIVADANGVYWSNWWTGRLQMWRAADDTVLELGKSFAPFSLVVRHPLVYWTDDVRARIYVVPVP